MARKITYQDKVDLYEDSNINPINKVVANDMNEIKDVVNGNSQIASNNFGLDTDTWTSGATYSIGDIAVYNENTYKNLTGTNTSTPPDQDSTNWEVMPLIVDVYNTSTKNAYSCNETNNLIKDVYSLYETKTHKIWIDNKPIYRKVISASNIGTAFNTTISNIDNLFFANESRISWSFNSGAYPIDRADFYFDKSNNTIEAQNSDVATWNAILVLEYTKTTDTATRTINTNDNKKGNGDDGETKKEESK